jgi:KDO2-lipid IV(A) lauroyltransferase
MGITPARRIIRNAYANMGRSVAEFTRMGQLLPTLRERISIEGKELLDEALSRGRGALIMTAHLGNWELAGARMVAEGYAISPVYTPQRNGGGLEDFLEYQRTRTAGMNLIPSEGPGLRKLFRVIREKGILLFLQDLDARKEGVRVPFLGMEASTAVGLITLYRKFRAPIVPIFTVRNPDGCTHTIYVQSVLSDLSEDDGAPFGTNVVKSLQICNNILTRWVEKYPDQWLWFLDRWESVEKELSR